MSITGKANLLKLFSIKGPKLNDDNLLLRERTKNITKWEEKDSKIGEKAIKKKKNKQVLTTLMQ